MVAFGAAPMAREPAKVSRAGWPEAGKGALIGAGAGAVLQPVIEGAGRRRASRDQCGRRLHRPLHAGRARADGRHRRLRTPRPTRRRCAQALENPNRIVPSVPGSRPTTFQQTGDMGLGALERRAETLDAVPFQQRRADQNAARVGMLEGIQPQGQPEAVVNTLRQNLADIDRMTSDALEAATANARGQSAALGGAGTPEGYGAHDAPAARRRPHSGEAAARTHCGVRLILTGRWRCRRPPPGEKGNRRYCPL